MTDAQAGGGGCELVQTIHVLYPCQCWPCVLSILLCIKIYVYVALAVTYMYINLSSSEVNQLLDRPFER